MRILRFSMLGGGNGTPGSSYILSAFKIHMFFYKLIIKDILYYILNINQNLQDILLKVPSIINHPEFHHNIWLICIVAFCYNDFQN